MVDLGDVWVVQLQVDSTLLLREVDSECRTGDLLLLNGLDNDVLIQSVCG